APWVDSIYSYIPVVLNQNINLTCKYNAEPPPQIDWYFNSNNINIMNDRFKNVVYYGTRQENYSEAILAIQNIQEDNFGDFKCKISNNLGTAEKTIHVSGRPGPPSLNVTGTTVYWTVQSIDPVLEYKIFYRLPHDDTWQFFKYKRAEKEDQHGDKWMKSEDLSWLDPGVEYQVQLQARNALGWGSLARSYVTLRLPEKEKKQIRR
ncbi:unnamed protein product, partial [Dracunculus medinensis]|uniref:Ig-like domain-containing protein n=1 Tax=Dracunculus medinensis TaxID=318479 RepID=A0A0N4U8B7_DRAME